MLPCNLSTGRSSSPGCYMSPVPGGGVRVYVASSDPQRIAVFISRGVSCSFCPPDLRSIDELVSNMDDKLFDCITSDKHHVLHQLLPPERPDCGYSLRPRRHELCIALTSQSWLDELNFIHRMLYKDMYWMSNFILYLFPLFVTCATQLRHVSF